jgi:hypothetical protein
MDGLLRRKKEKNKKRRQEERALVHTNIKERQELQIPVGPPPSCYRISNPRVK